MEALLGFLFLLLIIAGIVGFINPAIVLRWSSNPTRKKFALYWFLSALLLGVISAQVGSPEDRAKKQSEASMTEATTLIEEGMYSDAILVLNEIEQDNDLYNQAQDLIQETYEKAESALKKKIESSIQEINEGIDFSVYHGSIESLQMQLVLFSSWSELITTGEISSNPNINVLAKELKSKVGQIQSQQFPLLRHGYAQIVAKTLWKNDIEVESSGTGHRNINFTGGLFAANQNKSDFQREIYDILEMFRFKQARYRWYSGESEYTYWTIYEGKDSDLYVF